MSLQSGLDFIVNKSAWNETWPELLTYKPRHRLCKQGFRLVFE